MPTPTELEAQIAELQRQLAEARRTAENEAAIVGDQNTAVQGNNNTTHITINTYAAPATPPRVAPDVAAYFTHLIAAHQHLRLQGIRAGSQPLSVNLEKVYVSLTALDRHSAPREAKDDTRDLYEGGTLTILRALGRYRRLVIVGDPGSGKTTLLAYLALTYARAARDGADTVKERLQLDEGDYLPLSLPLRHLGQHLLITPPSQDGAQVLLDFLLAYYAGKPSRCPPSFLPDAYRPGVRWCCWMAWTKWPTPNCARAWRD